MLWPNRVMVVCIGCTSDNCSKTLEAIFISQFQLGQELLRDAYVEQDHHKWNWHKKETKNCVSTSKGRGRTLLSVLQTALKTYLTVPSGAISQKYHIGVNPCPLTFSFFTWCDLMCPSWCVLELSGLGQIVCTSKCSKTDRYILMPNALKRGKKTF